MALALYQCHISFLFTQLYHQIDTVPSVQTTLQVLGTLSFQPPPFLIDDHSALVPLKLIIVSLVQLENTNCSMFVTLLPMMIEVSPVQSENALHPILITLLPMVTEVSPLQYLNAQLPILVTLSGMVIEISPVQPENAQSIGTGIFLSF